MKTIQEIREMYALTLTKPERDAIDWIGDRYAHGHDLYYLLSGSASTSPEDAGWDDEQDVTYHLAEHQAWELQEIVEADNLACFAGEFREKLHAFCSQIV